MNRLLLIRYDTERPDSRVMAGFLEKTIEVHRAEQIPATFFCTGMALEAMSAEFSAFYNEVKDDPLFDVQDHSYSHIGLGYTDGMSVEELRANYELSFGIHEQVFGKRPLGVSICGTGGKDGKRLSGFDETEKAQKELDAIAELGLRFINSHLTGINEHTAFTSYARVGHPEIMGFPSGYSDTGWMRETPHEEAMAFILSAIKTHADNDEHMPVMLHDWLAWNQSIDKELTHVKTIADHGRKLGYTLATHLECYENTSLWQ